MAKIIHFPKPEPDPDRFDLLHLEDEDPTEPVRHEEARPQVIRVQLVEPRPTAGSGLIQFLTGFSLSVGAIFIILALFG